MPNDAKLGRELAGKLQKQYTGLIRSVEFTYNTYVELDRIPQGDSYCFISPQHFLHMREAREVWREVIHLNVSLVSPAGSTDQWKWVDQWLESWDGLLRYTRSLSLFGRHHPMSIEQDSRFDLDLFQNDRRLFTQAVLTYNNTEVI